MEAVTRNDQDITSLILKWSKGDKQAEQQLYLFSYQKFKELARTLKNKSAEKHGSASLLDIAVNTTSLVHDAYLKIHQSTQVCHASRQEFYRYFSQSLYSILIDHARKSLAAKRNLDFADNAIASPDELQLMQLIELDSELNYLQKSHQRQVSVFLLKYLCAMPLAEISDIQQISLSTVEKDLLFVKRSLSQKLSSKK